MVGNQHQRAALERGVDSTGGIGENERSRAQFAQHANTERHMRRRIPLIQVRTTGHDRNFQRSQQPEDQLPRMTYGG